MCAVMVRYLLRMPFEMCGWDGFIWSILFVADSSFVQSIQRYSHVSFIQQRLSLLTISLSCSCFSSISVFFGMTVVRQSGECNSYLPSCKG